MKLNFSIDVILGNNKNESKQNEQETPNNKRRRIEEEDVVEYTSPNSKSLKLSPNACVKKTTNTQAVHEYKNLVNFQPLQFLPYTMNSSQVRHHPDYYPFHLPYMTYPASANIQQYKQSSPEQDQRIQRIGSSETTDEDTKRNTSEERGEIKETRSSTEESSPKSCDGKKSKNSSRVGRRLFSGLQILELEKAFAEKPYINRMERAVLAIQVKLTESQIKTWFQNRRTKEKRRGDGSDGEEATTLKTLSNKASRVPGYGIQFKPFFGPPDTHLHAAMTNYFTKKRAGILISE